MRDLVQQLRAELATTGCEDYLCEDAPGGRRARLRFIGRYQDREVVWDAELIALAADGGTAAQFLDIGEPGARGIPIRIGLGVPCIDRPTLLKTIIMVRNYKRLHPGRHEFGPAGPAAAERSTQ
jgi:hypothetical protein